MWILKPGFRLFYKDTVHIQTNLNFFQSISRDSTKIYIYTLLKASKRIPYLCSVFVSNLISLSVVSTFLKTTYSVKAL